MTRKGIGTGSIIFAVLIWNSAPLHALDLNSAQTAIDNGVITLQTLQDPTEGSWGHVEGLDYVYTAAAVEALRVTNHRNGAYYSGLAWLENHHARNNDLEARKIMALANRGNNIQPDLALVHASKRYLDQGGWGLSAGYIASPLESALVAQALYRANDPTNLESAVDYLVEAQRTDGSWSVGSMGAADAWFTAEVVLALHNQRRYAGVDSALNQAAIYLAAVNTNIDASTLSRVALALYKLNGLDATVDAQMTALLNKQVVPGNWGSPLSSANTIVALAHAIGVNVQEGDVRVILDDEQVRAGINATLGRATYSHITRAELDTITVLDLRGRNVTTLNGLQSASNLTEVQLSAAADITALSGIEGVTVVIDADSDDIADSADNCPYTPNAGQADVDSDLYGDACDADIDGDGMPNSWELTYNFNRYNAGDASEDPDDDGLLNLAEYEHGTDPHDPDTDGDTSNDGNEVANGYDPLDPNDQADVDGDGLLNDEELLIGTDPDNADTDGDKVGDGEEVDAGRNPLINEPAIIEILHGVLR